MIVVDEKNQKDIYSLILEKTYTKFQLARRIRILKDFVINHFFKILNEAKKLDLVETIENFFKTNQYEFLSNAEIKDDQQWLLALGEDFYKRFSLSNYTQIFKELEEKAKKHEYLIIFLPIELPLEEQKGIGFWLKNNLGNNLIYDISYDSSLVGGCALSLKGRYKDYSLKAKIAANHDQILNIFKNFKHG